MTKQVKQLDRVIIRFAGDSGDGMQLTGDRFTQESAVFGNDLVTLPNFPAEIRAPQGTLPGVSSFQVHFADHDILTAGDAPDVLVAMNPAALRANLGDLPDGATIIVDTHDFTARNLTKAGYDRQPARRRRPRGVRGAPGRPDRHDGRGGQGVRAVPQGRRPRQEHVRPRPAVVDVRPPDRVDDRVPRASRFAKVPDIRDANITAFKSGWNFGETTETFIVRYEVKPAPMAAGTYRNITGNLALAYGLIAGGVQSGLPVFLGSYPITPASDILHELSKHKSFGVTTFQAEDEIAGVGAAIGASFAGQPRRHHHLRPGHRAQVRGDRPRRDDRAAAARHRRAARRPLHRPADQDRAGRPAAGDVRPQRRGAGADRRAAVTRRLLRRRPRGRPDRHHLPHPGDAALRRLPRQRLRAVADPRGRRAARRSTPTSPPRRNHGDGRRRRVLALRARRRDPGPTVGDPRHPRPRAPHRRAREGRRPRQHLLRPRQPRLHGPHPPGQGRPDRRLAAAARGRRPRRRAPRCSCSGGARRTVRSAPAYAACARPATRSRRPTCATSTRSRRTSATSSRATTRCWSPR